MIPFLPIPHEEEQLRVGQYDYRQWRIEKEQANPAPPIQNVRFVHDPNWRQNAFWSLQAVRDGSHINVAVWLFWKMVRGLFALAALAVGGATLAVNGELRVLLFLCFAVWAFTEMWRSEKVTTWRFKLARR